MTTADRADAATDARPTDQNQTSDTRPDTATLAVAEAMGFDAGQVVQELGWDGDVDEVLRQAIMERIDADLIEDAVEAVDTVVLWWRAEDGEVADGLVDAMTDLSDTGHIWLLNPKIGQPGSVDPSDLAEGVTTSGLTLTSQVSVGDVWQAHKVVRPKGSRR